MSQHVQKLIECGVCYSAYDQKPKLPKVLSCGHTFCTGCLEDILENGKTLKCPTCRKYTVAPSGIAGLPTSFTMMAFVDSLCQICNKQLWSKTCDHCHRKACPVCERQHAETLRRIQDIHKSLQAELDTVKDACNEGVMDTIKAAKQELLEKVHSHYDQYVRLIEQDRSSKMEAIESHFDTEVSRHLPWLEEASQIVAESQAIVDTDLGVDLPSLEGNHKAQCEKSMKDLWDVRKRRPPKTSMEFYPPKDGFKPSLVYTGNLVQSKKSFNISEDRYPQYDRATWSNRIGEPSSKPGEFSETTGLTICPKTGRLFVLDAGNHRIQVFDKHMKFMYEFGHQGKNEDDLSEPFAIALTKDKLFITDNGSIKVTDLQGHFLYTFPCLDEYMMNGARGMDAYQDELYISDYFANNISIISTDGTYNRLYGADVAGHISGDLGSLSLSAEGQLVTCDSHGNIYIFDRQQNLVRTIEANTPPEYFKASSVTFDQHGHILACDSDGNIRVLDNSGIVKYTLTSQCKYLAMCSAIALSPDGEDIFVARGCEVNQLHVPFEDSQNCSTSDEFLDEDDYSSDELCTLNLSMS